MLYIFDKDDKFISVLTEETGLVDMWFKDYQNHLIDEPFVFNVKQNSPLLKHIADENQVAFYDRDNKLRLMRIKGLREVTTSDGGFDSHNIQATCEPSYLELYDHFIEDKRITNGTAQTALNRALEGSRYIGEVTVELGLATDNFYWIDGIGAVFKILVTWGGALKDTITLDDKNEIIERKLWIVQRLGADNGLIVEPDFNAESIERKTLSYVETALWGQGSSLEITDDDDEHTGGYTRYITFEDVVWSKSKGDPVDKPKGQKWVGDPQALNEYGYLHKGIRKHRFGHFSNQDYETPEELLMATWLELQERKLKEIIHEASIIAGDKIVSLGDTVTILNRNYNKPIELQSQITGLEYDPLRPKEDVVIVIGKYIDMNENPLQKDVDDLKDAIHKPRPTAPITDESFPDIKPGIPSNVEAYGGFQAIQLYWDYDSKVYISHYEVYGSQIADFIPDAQHLLYRGRVSSFVHDIDTDQKWYYYIRAVNKRGTASGFSQRVEASSVRVISDDILFGSIIADHLSNNLDIADKLAQNTIDAINRGPMEAIEYTQQEIIDTENRLLDQLNTEIGDVTGSIANLNEVASNLQNRADATDDLLSQHGGNFVRIEQDVNEIDGRISTTINKVESIDGVVKAQGLELITQTDLIHAKLDSLDYERDKTGIINRIESNELDIQATAAGLDLRVTKEEFEALSIGGRNLIRGSNNFNNVSSYDGFTVNTTPSVAVEEWNAKDATGIRAIAGDYTGVLRFLKNITSQIDTIVGETYTFSMYVRNDHTSPMIVHINGFEGRPEVRVEPNEQKRVVLTGVRSTFNLQIQFRTLTNAANLYCTVWRDQLEKGNKATDWTPAPEDTEAEITVVKNRVTTTETDLKVHAGWINAKAERSEVYTRTQTDGLLGDKVDFNIYSNKMTNLDLTIDGLNTTVSNTNATVNDLSGEIVNAQSQIANLEVQAGQVDIRVSDIRKDLTSTRSDMAAINVKADGIISTVENIQIGGRNLLTGTSGELKPATWSGWNVYPNEMVVASPGEVLTARVYYQNVTVVPLTLRFIYYKADNSIIESPIGNQIAVGEQGYATLTHTVPAGVVQLRLSLRRASSPGAGVTNTANYKELKLEKGNKATDWTPAPEDIDLRMTKSESKITQLSDEVDIKVDKNGVVASINVSPEGIRIDGNRHHITGQTLIDDAVIGTAAIANLSVTNAKIGTLAVGTAQLQDAAITNAKIANATIDDAKIASLSVNKLLAGTIDANIVKIRGGSAIDYTLIDGSYLESRGRYNRTWRGQASLHDIKLRFENGYLRARNDTENRSLYFSDYGVSTQVDGVNASGTLEFFSTINSSAGRGVTLTSEGVTTIEARGGAIHLDASTTINAKAPIFSPGFITSTTNAYIGTDNVLHVVNKGYVDGSSGSPIYRDVRAYDIYGRGFISSVTHAYIGTDDELRVVNKGLSDIYRDVRALGFIGNRVALGTHINGIHFHVQPAGDGEVRITERSGSGAYRPIRASSFPTGTSLRENKTDIEAFDESALDILRNITPYLYRIKGEEDNPYKQLGLMVDETPRYLHGESGDSMEMYALGTFALKGIKELDTKVIKIEDRLDEKDLEIQYLRQEIKQLEEKMTA